MNDNIWATILGISKTLDVTPEYALYEVSYINAMMYSSAIPMIGDESRDNVKKTDFNESLDACNPDNFKDFDGDFEIVRV